MARRVAEFEVVGPWSLETSRRFWEGFTPAALAGEPARPGCGRCSVLRVTGAEVKQKLAMPACTPNATAT